MRPKRKAPITSYWDRFFLRWVPVSYKKILKKLLHRYPLIPACLLFVFRIPIYLLRFTFCAQSKQKFVILTQGRTGSSLLVDLLNSHPAIHCDPEILNYKTPFLKPFLAAKLTQHRHDVYGFKLKLNQLTDRQNIVNPLEFFSFAGSQEWKVIYLKRQNTLDQTVSWYIAKNRGITEWRGADKMTEAPLIHIDCDDLVRRLKEKERIGAQESLIIQHIPHLVITYEDDLLDACKHQQTLDRVFSFLDLPSVPVNTQIKKLSGTKKMPDMIENFEEVKDRVNRTKYCLMLESE